MGQLLLVNMHQELDGTLADLQGRHVRKEIVPHKEAHEHCMEEQGNTFMLQIKSTVVLGCRQDGYPMSHNRVHSGARGPLSKHEDGLCSDMYPSL